MTTPPLLTIGMPTFRDWYGLHATLKNLQHQRRDGGFVNDVEFLVVDNEPNGPMGKANKHDCAKYRNCRYIPFGQVTGAAAAKNRVLSEARGSWVLCIDSHVDLMPGVLQLLVNFCREQDASPTRSDSDPYQRDDLFQGPLMNESGEHCVWTHWANLWGDNGMLGKQRQHRGLVQDPSHRPIEIALAGCGLFLVRRESWLGFHAEHRHFGGEEGYIHEKYRRAGRKCWCVPWLRWQHRFRYEGEASPFPTDWYSRCANYLWSYQELGYPDLPAIKANHVNGSTAQVERHGMESITISGRVTPEQWAELLNKIGVQDPDPSARPAPARMAETGLSDRDRSLLTALPCKSRGGRAGTVACNTGCRSTWGKEHALFDCRTHGLVTLGNMRTELTNCLGCQDRAA